MNDLPWDAFPEGNCDVNQIAKIPPVEKLVCSRYLSDRLRTLDSSRLESEYRLVIRPSDNVDLCEVVQTLLCLHLCVPGELNRLVLRI